MNALPTAAAKSTLLELPEGLKAAQNAATVIDSVYEWLDQVNAVGGLGNSAGIAKCSDMLQSLEKYRARTEALITEPLRKAIAEAAGGAA